MTKPPRINVYALSTAGRNKWVNVDDLPTEAEPLIDIEPGEVVTVKGIRFEIQVVSLEPPALVLVPMLNN